MLLRLGPYTIRFKPAGFSLIPLVLATAYCVYYLIDTKGYPLNTITYPYIMIAVTFLFIMAILFKHHIRLERLQDVPETEKRVPTQFVSAKVDTKRYTKTTILIIISLLYLWTLDFLGFTIGTFVYTLALFWLLGVKNKLQLLIYSGAFVLFLYFVSVTLMRLPLPKSAFLTFI